MANTVTAKDSTQGDRARLVARLRAQKIEHAKTFKAYGQGLGNIWATERADYSALVNLSRADSDALDSDGLFDALYPDGCEGFSSADAFWREDVRATESQVCDADFLEGFIEGALEVFESVRADL